MMNNNYIKVEMQPTPSKIGGSFNTVATFILDNIGIVFKNVLVKIDTGCSVSTIPLARFKLVKESCEELKERDIKNKVPYLISYGIETGSDIPPKPSTDKEKFECTALKFKHAISNFKICNVPINAECIHVNYNRTGNILIGMDILKDLDIHIGTVMTPNLEETGKTVFLACPRININIEYLSEVKRLFGIAL